MWVRASWTTKDGGIYLSDDAGHTWRLQAEMRGQAVRCAGRSQSPIRRRWWRAVCREFLRRATAVNGGGGSVRADSTEIHEIQSVAIDPADPNVIYAGTWHLPWRTTDGGEHWDNMKNGIIDDSDVFSIIVDPNSSKIVYASACSGIYKSENAGDLFHKVEGIPSTARRTLVLLQDPNHLDTVFAGTTEGLYRTDNAGKKWALTTGPEIIVNDVSVDLDDSQHVLLATDRGGVLSSSDGGNTFHASNSGFSARQVVALKRDANRPTTLFIGVVNDKDWGGVFESDNGAVSWTQRSNGLQGRDVFSLGQAPDGTMIAGTAHGIFRLDSDLEVWKRVEGIPLRPDAAGVVHAPAIVARPPVPIGRDHFAQRKTVVKTVAQRRSAPVKGKGKTQAKIQAKTTATTRSARLLATNKHPVARKGAKAAPLKPQVRAVASAKASRAVNAPAAGLPPAAPPVTTRIFDGSVYSVTTAGNTLLATTSSGLLASGDNGTTWAPAGPHSSLDWQMIASSKENVVAAGLHSIAFSKDAGLTWVPITVPEGLTQVAAVAVEPSGDVWVGGREGVYVSSDAGNIWTTPKNLYVNSVNSIFFDEASNRIVVTTGGSNSIVFLVQSPKHEINYADAGWNLRFARPLGDHLVAATLFDGIVVQPRMMPSPLTPAAAPKAAMSAATPATAGVPRD